MRRAVRHEQAATVEPTLVVQSTTPARPAPAPAPAPVTPPIVPSERGRARPARKGLWKLLLGGLLAAFTGSARRGNRWGGRTTNSRGLWSLLAGRSRRWNRPHHYKY